jgi:phage gpG-like protein
LNVDIDIDVKGIAKAQARFTGMIARSKTFEPIFVKAKKQIELSNAANFAANGLPAGGWAPLDPQYAAFKAAKFPGRGTLIGNGRLFRSVTTMTSGISSISPTKAEFGTNVEYAKFHQYGTRKMPKRKIIFEPQGFAKSTANDAVKWIAAE